MDSDFIKYPRISHLDSCLELLDGPVSVFEKLDGGNTQVRKIKGRVFSGVRSKFLGPERNMRMPWFKDFNHFVMSNFSFYNLPESLVVYGEWMAPHTLDYHKEFTDKFFLLDVFDLDSGRFLPYSDGKRLLEDIGVREVLYLKPLVDREKVALPKLKKLVSNSSFRSGQMEGLVIKDYWSNPQRFAKLWTSVINAEKKKISPEDIKRAVRGYLDLHEGRLDVKDLAREMTREYLDLGYNLTQKELEKLIKKHEGAYLVKN